MTHLLTCDPGLEDVVAAEVAERLPAAAPLARPYAERGQVRVEGADLAGLLALRTIHDVIEVRAEAAADTPEQVALALADLELPELRAARSFRVTTERVGRHAFHGVDVQRAAGGALVRRHGTRVDLEGFEVEVRVDVYGRHVVAGLRRTPVSLSRRIPRPVPLRSALKPTVAAAMLRLVGAHRRAGALLDPLCGAGTIPIEAKVLNPALSVFASDWDGPTLEIARASVAAAGVEVDLRLADARRLDLAYDRRFDWIVTDPPYGVRQARTNVARLYRTLLPSIAGALTEDGTAAIVAVKARTLLDALTATDLAPVERHAVRLGSVEAGIFVLRRRGLTRA